MQRVCCLIIVSFNRGGKVVWTLLLRVIRWIIDGDGGPARFAKHFLTGRRRPVLLPRALTVDPNYHNQTRLIRQLHHHGVHSQIAFLFTLLSFSFVSSFQCFFFPPPLTLSLFCCIGIFKGNVLFQCTLQSFGRNSLGLWWWRTVYWILLEIIYHIFGRHYLYTLQEHNKAYTYMAS